MRHTEAVLPAHLAARVEAPATLPRPDGHYVVYWMRVAFRAFDNPALDVALTMAHQLGVPAFVYQSATAPQQHASDRLHTFLLETARDAAGQLADRGLGCLLHLKRPDDPRPRLLELAAHAALVVTDACPVEPFFAWDELLAKSAPLWRVDASCVAPLYALGGVPTEPGAFRAVQAPAWAQALARPWLDVAPRHPPFVPEVSFSPVDWKQTSVAELVAACDIDHGVAPVPHTPGGTAAGEARWADFVEHRLAAYDRARADPLADGTSRMSPYLRVGAVSPFRLARDCQALGGPGATKYLEELLGWRELAWHYCLHHHDTTRLTALPAWAQETLAAHAHDRRDFLPSFEELARGQTGHALWDACQHHLAVHGELHTALRVGWARQVLEWIRTPQEALTLLLDLNDRYALDGGDPLSRFGILFCLGAMDTPGDETRPVTGRLRPRSLADVAGLDQGEFTRRSRHAARAHPLAVAVVGAGVAGAAAARAVADAGHAVTLFDAASVVGGRLCTVASGPQRLDLGAASFAVSDERLARWARAWWHERLVAEWAPRREGPAEGQGKLTAPKGLATLAQRLVHGLDARVGEPVGALVHVDARWRVRTPGDESLGEYDAVVVATPPAEAARLVEASSFRLAARLREVRPAPAWVVGVTFPDTLGLSLDLLDAHVGPLAQAARESSKPGRASAEAWVLRASPAWSRKHEHTPAADVAAALLESLFTVSGARAVTPTTTEWRHWPFAWAEVPLGEPCLWDAGAALAVCGDFCLGRTVQDAWLSGLAAAGRVLSLEDRVDEATRRRRASQMRLL